MKNLGIAGRLTSAFIVSPLTPLFLLAALILGIIALVTLPREEEPQISVPMVDIHVATNGLKAEDAVKLVTEPLETIVKSIDGVEHVYSQTTDDGAMVTARFVVGTDSDTAILRVEQLYPFPEAELTEALDAHPNAHEILWVQEEPANMGALTFMVPRLKRIAKDRQVLTVKRSASASPSTGSAKAHEMEQRTVIDLALGGK